MVDYTPATFREHLEGLAAEHGTEAEITAILDRVDGARLEDILDAAQTNPAILEIFTDAAQDAAKATALETTMASNLGRDSFITYATEAPERIELLTGPEGIIANRTHMALQDAIRIAEGGQPTRNSAYYIPPHERTEGSVEQTILDARADIPDLQAALRVSAETAGIPLTEIAALTNAADATLAVAPVARGEFDSDALSAELGENSLWWTTEFEGSTPDQVIDGLDAATTDNPQMDTFIQTLRDNPDMAQALQRALAEEGSDLLGEIEHLVEGTNTQFSLATLNTALETEGGRNLFTNTLELLAEDRIETRHFEGMMASFHGADGHEGRFIAALDPSKTELLSIINAGGSPDSLRALIAEKTPQEFITAVGTAFEGNDDVTGIVDLIAGDEELRDAIHAVVVAEPEALEGLQGILGATGEGAFSAADLQEILDNPISRNALTDVLEVVAESDEFTFAHVTQLMEHHRNDDQAAMLSLMTEMGVTPGLGFDDFGEFFQDFMENPEAAINDLVNMLVETGQIPAEMGDTIRGFAVPMGNLMAGMIEPYHEVAMRHDFSLSTMVANADERGAATRLAHGGPDVPDLTGDGGEEVIAGGAGGDTLVVADPLTSVEEAALETDVLETDVAAVDPSLLTRTAYTGTHADLGATDRGATLTGTEVVADLDARTPVLSAGQFDVASLLHVPAADQVSLMLHDASAEAEAVGATVRAATPASSFGMA